MMFSKCFNRTTELYIIIARNQKENINPVQLNDFINLKSTNNDISSDKGLVMVNPYESYHIFIASPRSYRGQKEKEVMYNS